MKHLKKILVADDDRSAREAVKKIFGMDYTVLEARNGNEALAVLRKNVRDIAAVLLDMDMPVMDGWEFLSARAAEGLSAVPIIALTPDNHPDTLLRLMDCGVYETVQKPIDPRVIKRRTDNAAALALAGYAYSDPIQRQLIDLLNNGISGGIISTLLEPEAPIKYISESFVSHLGYESYTQMMEELSGRWDNAIYPEDRDGKLAEVAGTLSPDDEYTMEYRMLRRDGSLIWVRENGRVVKFADGEKAVVGLCIDITSIVELKNEIDKKSKDLAAITGAVQAGICRLSCDSRLTIRYANEFFFNLSGYSEKTAAAVGFDCLEFVMPEEEYKKLWGTLSRVLGEGASNNFEIETRARTIDGKFIWVLGRCSYSTKNGGEISAVVVDITERKHMEEQLRISEEQYRIAARHSEKLLFRFDIKERTLYSYFDSMAENGVPPVLHDMPESFAAGDVLMEETREDYLDMYRRIIAGEPDGEAMVRMRNSSGEPRWYGVRFTNIFMEPGEARHAVISMQDITERRERELVYEELERSVGQVPDNGMVNYHIDLTADICVQECGNPPQHLSESENNIYSAIVRRCATSYVYFEDVQLYSDFMNTQRLVSCYYNGTTEAEIDLRMQREGEPHWRHISVKLTQAPQTGHIIAFFTFRDIDEKKRSELMLQARSREDALTGTLNRSTFIECAEDFIRQGGGAQHAFVMIDLDGFKAVNDTLGHAMGDRVLLELAKSLKSLLRTGDLLGRLGGDEFMVCLKNIPYDDVIEKRAALICKLLCKSIADSVSISGSLGIALFPRDGSTFDELYRRADVALYEAKRQGRNRYIFFDKDMEDGRTTDSTPIDELTLTDGADDDTSRRVKEIVSQNTMLLRRQSEDERYRLIMEGSGTVVFEWNAEQQSFYSSEGFQRYVLSTHNAEELTACMGGEDTTHPDDRELLRGVYKRIFEGAIHAETTLRLHLCAGGYAWCRIAVICARTESGKLRRMVGTINELDVEHEQARIQLQAISEYMAGGTILAEVMPDGAIKLKYVSPSYITATGREGGEMSDCESDILSLVHPQDREALRNELINSIAVGKVADHVYRAVDLEGNELGWRHIRAGRIPSDETENTMLIAVVTDVTDMHNVTARMQAILDNAPCGIALYEVGRKRLVPVFASRRFTVAASESTVSGGHIERFIHPDDMQGVMQEIAEVVGEKRAGECIFRSAPTAGPERWLLARGVPMESQGKKPLMLVMVTDITEQKQLELKYKLGQEQLSLAFEMSTAATYEIDIRGDRLIRSAAAINKYGTRDSVMEDMPESYIHAAVHPDSAEDFRKYYRSIKEGIPSGSCLMRIKDSSGQFVLTRTSYRLVFDDKGFPYCAVGITEDAENVAEARFRFEQEEKLYALIRHDVSCTAKVNVSKNRVDRIWIRSMSDEELKKIKTHTQNCAHWFSLLPNDEERAAVADKFSLEALKAAHAAGTEWLYTEFRRSEPDGRLSWMENNARLLVNPYDGDLYAFFYQRDIDIRKKWELMLSVTVRRDPILAVYDSPTTKALAQSVIELKRNSGELCALCVLRIINMSELKEQFGALSAQGILRSAERKIKSVLRSKHIIGSSEDGVTVLFTDISSEAWAQKKCADLLSLIRDPNLTSAAAEQYAEYDGAVTVSRINDADFDSMYASVTGMLSTGAEAGTDIEVPSQNSRAIDSDTYDTFLRLLASLQSSRNYDEALTSMLHHMAVYYDCDRASMFELRGMGAVTSAAEFTQHKAESLMREFSSFSIERTPLLGAIADSRQTMRISDIRELQSMGLEMEYAMMKKRGIHSIMIVPTIDNGAVNGFISIANPRRQAGNSRLMEEISGFAAAELNVRRRGISVSAPGRDELTGLRDRRAYMEYAAAARPEALSSLGAVMVDIIGLRRINLRYGNQYGDELIRRVADILGSCFKTGSIYRYNGGAFLILCPDSGREDFDLNAKSASDRLAEELPGTAAIGCTWTDTVKGVELTVAHAEERMIASKGKLTAGESTVDSSGVQSALTHIKNAIELGRVFMLLQPKIGVNDRILCGAEALVRMTDKNGAVLTPAKFVPMYENIGLIRHIDLFVLEETAKVLARWRREGRKLCPVSVNFSRSTMVEPGIVETLKDTVDRYGVPHEYIEIEITEGLGDIERSTIASIGKDMLSAGFGLSLDDFGSDYANLSMLSAVEFTSVKLDKSIVEQVSSSDRSRSVVAMVAELCRRLDMRTVAEGVETDEQFARLSALGCSAVQGYLFSKPISVTEFEKLYMKKPD